MKNKYSFKRVFLWLITCVVSFVLLFGWLFVNIWWMENIYKFIFWFGVVVVTIATCSNEAKMKTNEKGRSVPTTIAVVSDIVVVLVLAGTGHFVYAGFCVYQIMLEFYIFDCE